MAGRWRPRGTKGSVVGLSTLLALGSLATVIGNLLADIAYVVLDPRVRYVSG
jgi:ABC-type dipeptide/oligopeptide/nickel transport system permease component